MTAGADVDPWLEFKRLRDQLRSAVAWPGLN
jgi:hypothetical protein